MFCCVVPRHRWTPWCNEAHIGRVPSRSSTAWGWDLSWGPGLCWSKMCGGRTVPYFANPLLNNQPVGGNAANLNICWSWVWRRLLFFAAFPLQFPSSFGQFGCILLDSNSYVPGGTGGLSDCYQPHKPHINHSKHTSKSSNYDIQSLIHANVAKVANLEVHGKHEDKCHTPQGRMSESWPHRLQHLDEGPSWFRGIR